MIKILGFDLLEGQERKNPKLVQAGTWARGENPTITTRLWGEMPLSHEAEACQCCQHGDSGKTPSTPTARIYLGPGQPQPDLQ